KSCASSFRERGLFIRSRGPESAPFQKCAPADGGGGFGFQVQSQMRNGMAFRSKKIPHLGHLSGCFQGRMRCNGETGQAGLNFNHWRSARGGSRFNTAANFGAIRGGFSLSRGEALNRTTASWSALQSAQAMV